jgi:hypothetical protein
MDRFRIKGFVLAYYFLGRLIKPYVYCHAAVVGSFVFL